MSHTSVSVIVDNTSHVSHHVSGSGKHPVLEIAGVRIQAAVGPMYPHSDPAAFFREVAAQATELADEYDKAVQS